MIPIEKLNTVVNTIVFVNLQDTWRVGKLLCNCSLEDTVSVKLLSNDSSCLICPKKAVYLFDLYSDPFISTSSKFHYLEISMELLSALDEYKACVPPTTAFPYMHEFIFNDITFSKAHSLFIASKSSLKIPSDHNYTVHRSKKIKVSHSSGDADQFISAASEHLFAQEDFIKDKLSFFPPDPSTPDDLKADISSIDTTQVMLFKLFKAVWIKGGFAAIDWTEFVETYEGLSSCFSSSESFDLFQKCSISSKIDFLTRTYKEKIYPFEQESYRILEKNRLRLQVLDSVSFVNPVEILTIAKDQQKWSFLQKCIEFNKIYRGDLEEAELTPKKAPNHFEYPDQNPEVMIFPSVTANSTDCFKFSSRETGKFPRTEYFTRLLLTNKFAEKSNNKSIMKCDEEHQLQKFTWPINNPHRPITQDPGFDSLAPENLESIEKIMNFQELFETTYLKRNPLYCNDFGFGVDCSENSFKHTLEGHGISTKVNNNLCRYNYYLIDEMQKINATDVLFDKQLQSRFAKPELESPTITIKKEADLELFLENSALSTFSSMESLTNSDYEEFDKYFALVSIQEVQLSEIRKRFYHTLDSFKQIQKQMDALMKTQSEINP